MRDEIAPAVEREDDKKEVLYDVPVAFAANLNASAAAKKKEMRDMCMLATFFLGFVPIS
jgi:hypothetical protein